MAHPQLVKRFDLKASGPGFVGYLVVIMWFLLTVMAANTASAQETAAPSARMVLTAADILPQIEEALSEKGMAPGAEIVLNRPDQAFATQGDVAIAFVSFNQRSGRFVIRLKDQAAAITGAARVTEIFPTLSRNLDRGDIIRENDIAYVEAADARAHLFVRNAEDLVGKEARRPLPAQTPLRSSDVLAPVLVKKGALVTLTYNVEGMRLSHQGIALGAGAAGDVISVRNVQSDRLLKAVIDGENHVRVDVLHARNRMLEG